MVGKEDWHIVTGIQSRKNGNLEPMKYRYSLGRNGKYLEFLKSRVNRFNIAAIYTKSTTSYPRADNSDLDTITNSFIGCSYK